MPSAYGAPRLLGGETEASSRPVRSLRTAARTACPALCLLASSPSPRSKTFFSFLKETGCRCLPRRPVPRCFGQALVAGIGIIMI